MREIVPRCIVKIPQKDKTAKISSLVVTVLLIMTTMQLAHAVPQKSICILEPMDIISYKDSGIVGLVNSTVNKLHVTSKVVGFFDQANGNYNSCDVIIHLQRMLNTNDRFADKSIPFVMESSGNKTNITIFTHKTQIGGFSDATLRNTVMTNCYGLGERFPHMYGTQNDYESNTWCDPYQSYRSSQYSDQLPNYVIEKSVITALAKLGIV